MSTKTLPLSVTLNNISLSGFGVDQSSHGTTSITGYNGSPFYCHAIPVSGGIEISIDENYPSSFTAQSGAVVKVDLTFTDANGARTIITWNPAAGSTYNGFPLEHHLVFSDTLTTATMLVTQPSQSAGTSTINTLGIVILGKEITQGAPEGYFISVPTNKNGTYDPTDHLSAGISWTPPGSASGPIGGVTFP